MSRLAVLCNDGLEEVECLTPVDFCRRAGIEVVTVSVTGNSIVTGAHDVSFKTDIMFEDLDADSFDAVFYPGGPGTGRFGEIAGVRELAGKFLSEGKLVAAICAAPGMLSEGGILKGKRATGFPGCKPEGNALWTENTVERDGNLITGKGAGAAPYFAFEIISYLESPEKADEVYDNVQMPPKQK